MKLAKEQLDSFAELYKKEFGETIDRAEAQRQATALISLVKLIYEPMNRKNLKKYSSLKK